MTDHGNVKLGGGGPEGTWKLNRPEGLCVMRQRWRDLLFLHWAFDPAVIQATLPAGLTVDTFRGEAEGPGQAYVGIVPFLMERVRPRFCPPVPGVSWFGELNLRTYVIGPDGRPGVWFYSLDAHQRLAVWLARTCFKLPYHYAKIHQQQTEVRVSAPAHGRGYAHATDASREIAYWWNRSNALKKEKPTGRSPQDADAHRAGAGPAFMYNAPPASAARPAEVGTLSHWLVERYLLFSRRPLFVPGPENTVPSEGGAIDVGRVEHTPYRIAEVEASRVEVSLFGLNGFAAPEGGPVSALWSPGVDVSIYPLRRAAMPAKPPG